MRQQNILLIHADQHRADCLGVNGHPFLQTPNLDRLATQGANFTRAYTPIPLCTPARTSLLTGQWPMQHGVIANHGTEGERALNDDVPTVSQLLRDAGYWLGYTGKWGVDPQRDPTHFGFHLYLSERDYARRRQAMGLLPRPHTNRWFGEVDPHIVPEQSQLAWGADMTIQLLEHAVQQGQPFFLRWDPSEPHLPNIVPEPYASMYPAETIPPWPNFSDDLVGKPYIQQQQRRTWAIEDWTWHQWAAIVGRYLGEITLLDHQIGRVLATLDTLGIAENTVVIYSADHGDLCGSHGMIDKHYVMYEELVRVPLIVRYPDVRYPDEMAAGQAVSEFVSSELDVAATICDCANVARPATFAGQSLLPLLLQNKMDTQRWERREDIFATYHGNQFGLYSQRMVRDERWKYVWNATAEEELYDTIADPGELQNLAADVQWQDECHRLRRRLLHWMQATDDRLLNSWTKRFLESSP